MAFKQPDLGLESERQSCVLTTTPPRLVSKSVRPFFFKDSKTREESGMEEVKPQATAISYEAPDRTVSVSISCNYCHYSDLSKLKISTKQKNLVQIWLYSLSVGKSFCQVSCRGHLTKTARAFCLPLSQCWKRYQKTFSTENPPYPEQWRLYTEASTR